MTDSIIEETLAHLNKETEAKKRLLAVRQEYNRKIMYQIEQLMDLYPEQRFMQLLENFVVRCDKFYEEPQATYERLEITLKHIYEKR